VTVELEAEEILTKTVNQTGQIYLSRDLAGQEVRVAVEVVDNGDDADE
jgi:hypothetical protein